MSWDPSSDAWLAGFIDGEGSFAIVTTDKRNLVPRFLIGLRADDTPIITTLCATFGGSVSYVMRRNTKRLAVQWTVVGRADLVRIVDYLDRYPLHAKKSRDYAIWRQAVIVYLNSRKSSDVRDELSALKEMIEVTRQYVEPPLPLKVQLRLRPPEHT